MKKLILLLVLSFGFITFAQADDLVDYGDQAPSHTGAETSAKNCTECDKNSTNPLPESLLTQDTNRTDVARVNDALGTKGSNKNNNGESEEVK